MKGGRIDSRAIAALFAIVVLVAFYRGFRMPSAWCATFDAASIFDGCHRRWLLGTLLHPLAIVFDYDYRLFAAVNFIVLALIVGVIARAAMTARTASEQILCVAWFLLPTGGFLFHEAGYHEQVNYLLLFAAIALVHRRHLIAATILMALTPLVHEAAVATVIPLFGIVVLRREPLPRAIAAVAIPAVIGAVQLVIQPGAPNATAELLAHLHGANFAVRHDAAAFFTSAPTDFVHHYDGLAAALLPLAAVEVITFIVLWCLDWRSWGSDEDRNPSALVLLASSVAIAAPFVLVHGGADGNRWQFMLAANWFIIVWISLDRRTKELPRRCAIVGVAALLLISHFLALYYFDGASPRPLESTQVERFVKHVRTRSVFLFPDR